MDWKKLERHPLSAEYEDLKGRTWDRFVENLRKHGVQNGRKVVLHDGKVIDAWQLQRGCVECNIKPEYEKLDLPDGQTLEEWVEMRNDLRRHETQEKAEKRANERRERVAKAKAEGQSIRTIAATEGVSPKTIHADLEKAGVTGVTVTTSEGGNSENSAENDGTGSGDEDEAARTAREKEESEDRKRIRQYILDHPGASNREVGRELKVSDHTVADVKRKMSVDNLLPTPPSGGSDTPPTSPKRKKKKKNGSESVDWKGIESHFGKLVRAMEAVGGKYPNEKKSKEYAEGRRLLSSFWAIWESWKKRLTKV